MLVDEHGAFPYLSQIYLRVHPKGCLPTWGFSFTGFGHPEVLQLHPIPIIPLQKQWFPCMFQIMFSDIREVADVPIMSHPLSVQPGDPKEYDLPGQSRQSLAEAKGSQAGQVFLF